MTNALNLVRALNQSSPIQGSDATNTKGLTAAKKSINDAKSKKRKAAGFGGVDAVTTEEDDTPVIGIGPITGNDNTTVTPPEQPVIEKPTAPSNDGGDPEILTVTKEELATIANKRAEQLAADRSVTLEAQLVATKTDFDKKVADQAAAMKSMEDQLAAEQAEKDRLKQIFNATGSVLGDSNGLRDSAVGQYNVNFLKLPRSKELQGAAREFADILNNPAYTPTKTAEDEDGTLVVARDRRQTVAFVKANRDALRTDMELYAKGNGLLLGDAAQAGFTFGGAGSIPDAFLDYLSAEMRMAKSEKYVWHQFANFRLQLGQGPGNNILVPKFENLDEPTSEADYILETFDTINNISTDNQAMIMNTVPVQIKGYGLGLGTGIANRAVVIPEFIRATSMVELLGVLNSKLQRNYDGFEDMMIRMYYRWARYNPANVFYNNSGSATNDPLTVVAGSDGTMTEAYLSDMFAAQTDADVPSLVDGRRIAVLANKSASQLKSDLGTQWEAPNEAGLQEMTNILNASYPSGDVNKVSGYMGEYGGYHCFLNLSSSKGATGSEGVYAGDAIETGTAVNIALGVTTPAAVTVRDNYFFGPDAVARGTALAMELREDDSNQFGTKMRFIWRSIEGFGPMGVSSLDAAGAATNQEDCVFIGRATDTLV